jgi:flagellar M-ring protein FliF
MVRNIVEGVVGPGKARVQVTADVDLNRVTTSEEKFDPDGQVIRSERTVEANSKDSKGSGGQAVSTANNIPGQDPGASTSTDGSQTGSNESVTNYEISKTTRTEVQEPGTVKRLSVAVAVDGITTIGPKGKVTYAPRSADEMKRIESLVRSAVGFDASRQDQVTVVNVRFSHDEDAEGVTAGNPLFGFDKNDLMRGGELGVLLIVAALIVFFVARPLMKGATSGGGGFQSMPMLTASAAGGGTLQIEGAGGHAALPAGEGGQGIDMAKIEGQVKASSVKRVAEFVDSHPDESVSILRSWLHESA